MEHFAQLAHKIKNGQTIQEAVKEIISRSSSEVRQKAFGEAIQDGKTLGWTRQQIWTVIKLLAKRSEVGQNCLEHVKW